ncbi:hypothetical protein BD626DRAFT_501541 [Schizophyllum amplum]|uniref:Uncharacterized protein n=1 Tax=Schizophyllum amplum TaxID=97359 RepID=A0A550C9Y6_9AGAR|nr:hypothetical protein BD626DRAFT_501541 [Auriculariopsis ampla]
MSPLSGHILEVLLRNLDCHILCHGHATALRRFTVGRFILLSSPLLSGHIFLRSCSAIATIHAENSQSRCRS